MVGVTSTRKSALSCTPHPLLSLLLPTSSRWRSISRCTARALRIPDGAWRRRGALVTRVVRFFGNIANELYWQTPFQSVGPDFNFDTAKVLHVREGCRVSGSHDRALSDPSGSRVGRRTSPTIVWTGT